MSVIPFVNPEDHREEVIERWGEPAWTQSNSWWSKLDNAGRDAFLAEGVAVNQGYRAIRESGGAVTEPQVGELVARHRAWITQGWGGVEPTDEQFIGLGEMYVADERFARNYGGVDGASFVRDAIIFWVTHRAASAS